CGRTARRSMPAVEGRRGSGEQRTRRLSDKRLAETFQLSQLAACPGLVGAGMIRVVLSFDDNFWALAYAVMRSACLSSKRRAEMVFHLLHMPLCGEHRHDLEAITREFGAELRWYPLAGKP